MPRPKMNWTPGLQSVIAEATAEFTTNLIGVIIDRISGKKIPDDELARRIRRPLKQETIYKLAVELNKAVDKPE